jgi:hypothetical protein
VAQNKPDKVKAMVEPEPEFDKDIELAKLQAKISAKQTETYGFVSIILVLGVGLTAVLFILPGMSETVALLPLFATLVVAGWRLHDWDAFRSNILTRDFSKLYRKEKIDLED